MSQHSVWLSNQVTPPEYKMISRFLYGLLCSTRRATSTLWRLIRLAVAIFLLATIYCRTRDLITSWHRVADVTGNIYHHLPHKDDYLKFSMTAEQSVESCQSSSSVILVKTVVNSFSHRLAIRTTWGSLRHKRRTATNRTASIAFIIGLPAVQDEQVTKQLQAESAKYGDIIQYNAVDNYYNLTYKLIASLNWTLTYCSGNDYFLSVDDDIAISTDLIQGLLDRQHGKNFIMCFVEKNPRILRWWDICLPCSKWCVDADEFPGKTHYPYYFCHGILYAMPLQLMRKLYQLTQTTPYFRLDDVYLTSLVAVQVKGLKLVDVRSKMFIHNGEKLLNSLPFFSMPNPLLISVTSPEELHETWQKYF